jgi:hypothetical protein
MWFQKECLRIKFISQQSKFAEQAYCQILGIKRIQGWIFWDRDGEGYLDVRTSWLGKKDLNFGP